MEYSIWRTVDKHTHIARLARTRLPFLLQTTLARVNEQSYLARVVCRLPRRAYRSAVVISGQRDFAPALMASMISRRPSSVSEVGSSARGPQFDRQSRPSVRLAVMSLARHNNAALIELVATVVAAATVSGVYINHSLAISTARVKLSAAVSAAADRCSVGQSGENSGVVV